MRALPFPDPHLTDGVVLLRAKGAEDSPGLAEALSDPEVPRWTTIPPRYGIAEADLWLHRSEDRRLAGEELNLLIATAGDERVLGTIGLMPGLPGVAQLGYVVGAGDRGRGHCTRAVVLLRDWATGTLGFERIEIVADPANVPSCRVAEKAGFRDSGERRPDARTPGGDPDHAVYVWTP